MLGTINKAGHVLDLFTIGHPEWGLSEIARQLHSPRSTVYELLASLVEIGMLSRTLLGRYRLGQRMISFSNLFLKTSLITQSSSHILDELSQQFDDPAHIAVLDDLEAVLVSVAKSPLLELNHIREGVRFPAHCTAVGKILLAECDWKLIKPVLETRGLAQYTTNTITQPDRLQAELENVRRNGWAETVDEMVVNVASVASGVRDERGQIVAALGVIVPIQRFMSQREYIRTAIMNACTQVSANMGYRGQKTACPTVVASITTPAVAVTPEQPVASTFTLPVATYSES